MYGMQSYDEITCGGRLQLRVMKQQGAAFGSRRPDCRRRRRHDEWATASFKSKTITITDDHDNHENRIARRYSASHATSFREQQEEEEEEEKEEGNGTRTIINNKSSASSRSNFTVSSTFSSPGYNFKEEIDPPPYSFTTALRALHGRRWESSRGEGRLALNSKWDEAEKYISNPLSGEVPVECLSANTRLAGCGRSFRSSDRGGRRRVSMSAPLFYPPKPHHQHHHLLLGVIDKTPAATVPNKIEKEKESTTAPTLLATPTPSSSIQESSSRIMRTTTHSPPSSSSSPKVLYSQDEEKGEEIKGESRKDSEAAVVTGKNELGEKGKQETAAEAEELRRRRPGGCLSWRRFAWMRKRERDKEKPTKNKNSHCRSIFLCPIHEW